MQCTPAPLHEAFTQHSPAGLVFDMDGTIIDTRDFHMDSWRTLVSRYDLFGEREYRLAESGFGRTNQAIFESWFNGPSEDWDFEALAEEKEEAFRELIRGKAHFRPGFDQLLALCKEQGIKIALATSAPEENALFLLDEMGIREHFDAIVTSAMGLRSKPIADFFLKAAEMLGLAPGHCIGFEDSTHGCEAVLAAGMPLIGIAERPEDVPTLQGYTNEVYEDFMGLAKRLQTLL